MSVADNEVFDMMNCCDDIGIVTEAKKHEKIC